MLESAFNALNSELNAIGESACKLALHVDVTVKDFLGRVLGFAGFGIRVARL